MSERVQFSLVDLKQEARKSRHEGVPKADSRALNRRMDLAFLKRITGTQLETYVHYVCSLE